MASNKNLTTNTAQNFILKGVNSIQIGLYILIASYVINDSILGFVAEENPMGMLSVEIIETTPVVKEETQEDFLSAVTDFRENPMLNNNFMDNKDTIYCPENYGIKQGLIPDSKHIEKKKCC